MAHQARAFMDAIRLDPVILLFAGNGNGPDVPDQAFEVGVQFLELDGGCGRNLFLEDMILQGSRKTVEDVQGIIALFEDVFGGARGSGSIGCNGVCESIDHVRGFAQESREIGFDRAWQGRGALQVMQVPGNGV